MTDKFEFKKQHALEGSESKFKMRVKPSLIQYKQVIVELSEALNGMSKENDELKMQMSKLTEKYNKLENEYKSETGKVKQLSIKQWSARQQKLKINEILQKNMIEIQRKDEKIKWLEQKSVEMEQKNKQYYEKISSYQKLNQVNLQKIRILEENLQNLIQQNKHIKIEAQCVNKFNQDQLRDLKAFNDQIKRKFQMIQQNEPNHVFQSQQTRFDQKMSEFKEKRSFSTEKKQRRNIGCLSINNNLQKRTNRSKGNYPEYSHFQNIKPFEASAINPQLGQQLKSLKKQIAHQYTLINMKNQAYNKQRVNKALEELKRKMGKVIEAAEHSEGQSFQY